MTELDQAAIDRARATLLAHLNNEIYRSEQYFAGMGVNRLPRPRYTAEQLTTWRFGPYEEWLIFTPPGDNYGAPMYLVSEGTAYRLDLTRESYEDALNSARALKARAGP